MVAPRAPSVQTPGGRTSPLIVVAPNQLQQFGAQIIMLPSPKPNPVPASSQTKATESTSGQVVTVTQPAEGAAKSSSSESVPGSTEMVADSSAVLNTISLPETSSCSPEGEALLDKLDQMDAGSAGVSPVKRKPGGDTSGAVSLHELTAYLTGDESETSVTTSTHSNTMTSQSSVTVTSSQQQAVATATVSSSEGNVGDIEVVTRSLGFNPISPAGQDNVDGVKTSESQGNPNLKQINVEISGDAKVLHVAQSSATAGTRPNSREGVYSSLQLQGGRRSRPNSRGDAASPSSKQGGGFVQLGEHTRDSPNIFVSIHSAMPPTGKLNAYYSTPSYLFIRSVF